MPVRSSNQAQLRRKGPATGAGTSPMKSPRSSGSAGTGASDPAVRSLIGCAPAAATQCCSPAGTPAPAWRHSTPQPSDLLLEPVGDLQIVLALRVDVHAVHPLGERLRRRTTNVAPGDGVQPAVAGALEERERGFPVHVALHVAADVAEGVELSLVLGHVDDPVDGGCRRAEAKRHGSDPCGGEALRDVVDRSTLDGDPDLLRRGPQRAEQKTDRRHGEHGGDQSGHGAGAPDQELATADATHAHPGGPSWKEGGVAGWLVAPTRAVIAMARKRRQKKPAAPETRTAAR